MPGTTDTGNHGDDQVTSVPLPFPYTACGVTQNSINVSSNGNAQFNTSDADFTNVCLPWTGHDCTIFPYWDDLRTDPNSGCSSFPGGSCGVYTSVTGSAPNRIFNIEWRAVYFATPTNTANFELRLYEGQNRVDVIYGDTASGNSSATAGMQSNDTCFAQYFCNGDGGPPAGGWTVGPAGTPSPTPTATPSAQLQLQHRTPTATATNSYGHSDGHNTSTNSYTNCNSDSYSDTHSAPNSYTTIQSASASTSNSATETLDCSDQLPESCRLLVTGRLMCENVFQRLTCMFNTQ